MWQIFFGSLLLSLIHALIPHHWIPIIAIAKTEKWNTREALSATFITGVSHMISTIIIGIIVGFVGIKLAESYSYITTVAAPTILLVIGVIYLILDFRDSKHHHHHFDIDEEKLKNKKSKTAIITSLSVAMFLMPCFEIEAYYFQAANFGWPGIFVLLGIKGVNKLNLSFLEHHSKRVTGIILILLGFAAYFVEF
jgi:nickel/cobalt transporter (NicO) family protein